MFVLTVQRCHEPTDLRKNNFLHLNFGQKMNYFLTCASEKNPDLLGPKLEKLIEKLGVEFDFKYCYEDTQDTIGQTVDQTGLFEFVVSKDKNSPAGPACPSVGVFAFLLALFLFILLLVGLLFPLALFLFISPIRQKSLSLSSFLLALILSYEKEFCHLHMRHMTSRQDSVSLFPYHMLITVM